MPVRKDGIMSFVNHELVAEEGNTVIIFLNFQLFYAVRLIAGKTFQTKYGALRHDEIIGKRFGTRVHLKHGFVYVLMPTAELWTLSLPHRTQILYSRDISFVIFNLDLKSGCVVIESGTGSGSMTHCLARAVAPHGKVLTFDFHQKRSETAQQEFEDHGIGDIVQSSHRDVCSDGFGLYALADAVFLDLPHPWLAIEHGVKALKDAGGRICSFSPCIEQVQRTAEKLRELRCIDIVTFECLERPYEVKKIEMPTQSNNSQKGAEYFVTEDDHPLNTSSAAAVEENTEEAQAAAGQSYLNENNVNDTQTNKMDSEGAGGARDGLCSKKKLVNEIDPENPFKKNRPSYARSPKKSSETGGTLTAVPSIRMTGHTGYLTFGTFVGRQSEAAPLDPIPS